ncbi:MAG: Cna B-type domain-containing protein [Faecalispora jeddahensis]
MTVKGSKTWQHGDNPADKQPSSIIVEIYADGQLAAQRQVTARDGWKYAFEMPRYAGDGHEIVYTVDEVEIPGYTAEINGYDIVNAYTGATPESPAPGGDDEPGSPDGPQTGDTSHIGLYCADASKLSRADRHSAAEKKESTQNENTGVSVE